MGRKVRLTGEHLTHVMLWTTSRWFLAKGLAEVKGSFYPLIAAVTFGNFAFEAYLNTALRRVAPEVWQDERAFFSTGLYRGTLGKFEYLASACNYAVNRGRRPFQSVKKLSEARDFLAHARVEEFDLVIPAEKLDEPKPSPSVLDTYASADFAKRTLADLEQLADALQVALGRRFGQLPFGSDEHAFAGISRSWHAALIDESMPNTRLQPSAAKQRTKTTRIPPPRLKRKR